MMSKEGWIALHRKLQDNKLWNCEPFSRGQAWIDLLLMANHEEKSFLLGNQSMTIGRGQRFYSVEKLSKRWKWSEKKVRNFLTLLENEQMIIKKGQTKGTLVTIVNYDFYQSEGQAKGRTKGEQRASVGRTKGEQRATNNNDITMNNNDETMINNDTTNEGVMSVANTHDYNGDTNYENVVYFLNNNDYKGKAYLLENKPLWKAIAFWLQYKDDLAKINKTNWEKHHYSTVQGIQSLLSEIINRSKEYGVEAVIQAIQYSVSRQYQGIIWDKLEKPRPTRKQAQFNELMQSIQEGEKNEQYGITEVVSGNDDELPKFVFD